MTTHEINIDMDKKCAECNKDGATQNGLCLSCINKSICFKPMRSELGKRHQAYVKEKLTKKDNL